LSVGRNEFLSIADYKDEQNLEVVFFTAGKLAKKENAKDEFILFELRKGSPKTSNSTEIEVLQEIRTLVENRMLIPIQNSGVIKFRLRKQINKFEILQRKLQKAFLTERVNDIWHDILKEQDKEIKDFEKVIFPSQPSTTTEPNQEFKFSNRSGRKKEKKTWKNSIAFERQREVSLQAIMREEEKLQEQEEEEAVS
jgi:hypothetical protein